MVLNKPRGEMQLQNLHVLEIDSKHIPFIEVLSLL